MNNIAIYDLYSTNSKTFIDDLEPKELSIILGGLFWGFYPTSGLNPHSNVFITTIYDGINRVSTTYEGSNNFSDNKFNTIDNARTVNAWVNS
jgi:hypothetical protein